MIQSNEVNPNIKELNNKLLNRKITLADYWGYIDMQIRGLTCMNCERKVKPHTFKPIDKREYFISALCNKCQVYFFRKGI
tara:strand:+ start:529 stop:768 length:240 start_codon:yes stop_codon:yes gene_type:complete